MLDEEVGEREGWEVLQPSAVELKTLRTREEHPEGDAGSAAAASGHPVPRGVRGWHHAEKCWRHLSSVLRELGRHMHPHFWSRCPSGTFVTTISKAVTLTT